MRHIIQHIIGSTARTLLALTFIFSGLVKAIDPLGTVYKIEDYLKAFGGFFNDLLPFATVAAIALIVVECVLGVCLLANVRTRCTAWISFLFYLVMLPLTLYIAINNPVSDCGCFGDALVISNWATFYKNVVLMALTVVLLYMMRYIPSTFVWWGELSIAILTVAATGILMGYTYLHLPIKDFRPYKIGNHIPTLMEIPEDAEPDQYAISFIYEKNGVQQEFTLDNYPQGDSTWHFVDQKSTLVKKGFEPPIHDFALMTLDFEDVTFDILDSEKQVTLIIMYDLQKADLNQMDKVSELFLDCLQRRELCYVVTGSGEEEINTFCETIAGQSYSNELTPFNHPQMAFLTCDPVTLKTIVRANPGVIVLQQGTIVDKYNLRNK